MKSETQRLTDEALYDIHAKAKPPTPLPSFLPEKSPAAYLAPDGEPTDFDEPPRTIED